MSEYLYNGIVLPAEWPPADINLEDREPTPVPYLENPPEIIPVDLGRQLFVDDFLIASSSLQRVFHYPEKYAGNPILKPETELEQAGDAAVACPKSGGVWYDYNERIYKMWYEAGWCRCICYAESTDGINWTRPELDIFPGTNRITPFGTGCDSWTVVYDYHTDNDMERYKIFIQEPCGDARAMAFTSPDGIHWSLPVATGYAGDRSTMFYNPFRRKWCFSLRSGFGWKPGVEGMRARHYAEGSDYFQASQWGDTRKGRECRSVPWAHTDRLDMPHPETGRFPQLYNLDSVAYESIMLGFFQLHHGPSNEVCEKSGIPKITELQFAYSRDGFHWSRPDRNPALKSERSDVWDRGYVQSLGNICTVSSDLITFYFSGFQGDENCGRPNGMYHRGATGIAHLRRDGFASMSTDGVGELITPPVTFSGSYLFVNAAAKELRAEVLDMDGKVIASFTEANAIPFSGDSCCTCIGWKDGDSLSSLISRPVKIRFILKKGDLYSFWISPDKTGKSGGYLAGGGPGYHDYFDN